MEVRRRDEPRPEITIWLHDPQVEGSGLGVEPPRWTVQEGKWVGQQFLSDDVLGMTLELVMDEYRVKYAMWQHDPDGPWTLRKRVVGGTITRDYPSREAAEMIAIHNG